VLGLSLMFKIFAASIEVWLISYAGQLFDLLSHTAPEDIWRDHSTGLVFAAIMIVLIRPLGQFAT
jgi:ATP-binding cassette subfamily B multidrug efflux pump